MGILFFYNYTKKDNLSISINLQKSCYYPGEIISGKITLQVKTNKFSSVFNFTKAHISLTQIQQYQLISNNLLFSKNKEKKIYSKSYNFKQYKNRSIIIPLSFDFSIKSPIDLSPTLLISKNNFIKHFLTIYFPKIKYKKSIGIIIQNRQKFLSKELNLSSSDIRVIHNFRLFQKNKKLSYYFTTGKYSYAYNEIIPYEIIVNYLGKKNLRINLRVSLIRKVFYGANDKIDINMILFKDYSFNFNINEKIFKVSGHFLFPLLSDYFSVNPMNIYNYYNKKILENYDKDYRNVKLFPSCFSSLFICCYFLNLEISIDSFFTKSENLSIPIELYTPLKIEDDDGMESDMIIYNSDKAESLINNEETFGEDFENQKLINCDNKDIEMIKIEEDDFMKK